MRLPSSLRFQLRCLAYLWNFRREYPGKLTHVLVGYAFKRSFYEGLIWGGWFLTCFLLLQVSRPIWAPNTAMGFHAFDAFTLFLMPVLIIGIGRFSLQRLKMKWHRQRREAIITIRRKRRVHSAAGPGGGMVFSAGRIH